VCSLRDGGSRAQKKAKLCVRVRGLTCEAQSAFGERRELGRYRKFGGATLRKA
jgi:hypothetical protein